MSCDTYGIKSKYDGLYQEFLLNADKVPWLIGGVTGNIISWYTFVCDHWSKALIDWFRESICYYEPCTYNECFTVGGNNSNTTFCYQAECSEAKYASLSVAGSLEKPDPRGDFRKWWSSNSHTWVQVGIWNGDCDRKEWFYYDPWWDYGY